VQTDRHGNIEETCTNQPFGDNQQCSNSSLEATEQHFTGKERDTESGLDFFGARYYAGGMGRFMNPDWADKAEAVPYATLTNPHTLNLYAYVGNSPIGRADGDGHIYNGAAESSGDPDFGWYDEVVQSDAKQKKEQEQHAAQQAAQPQQVQQQTASPMLVTPQLPSLPEPPAPIDIAVIPAFTGSAADVTALSTAWTVLMHSANTRAYSRAAGLQDEPFVVHAITNDDQYFDPHDASINLNHNYHPLLSTTAGKQPVTTAIAEGRTWTSGQSPTR
jgi:RHS repeat-associated protein